MDYKWYQNLNLPTFTPPSWLFTPVWTILYITIFIALLFFTTTRSRRNKIKGYLYFITQLILNITWPFTFFGIKNIGLALTVVILMDIFVILTIKEFYKTNKFAGIILFPYLIWIFFATYLNISFLILN